MPSGGGGGGGAAQFKAQGAPPAFTYITPQQLNQMAVGGDISSYALSDKDFANRYPALQQAYNQYQSNLGQQVGLVGQGAVGQADIMAGMANTIAGRQGAGTTTDINAMRNAAATTAGAAQPIFNLGATQAGLAQPIANLGQAQAGLAAPMIGIGQGINRMGGQLAGAAQIPYQMGQQLLNEPIDPQTQQQMMRAGLGSAAGALGAGALGTGMAGQAAAARQLGLNTLQYGQAMRGEAMGDINQYASMLGAAGQMRGLGAQTIGAGGGQMTAGGQLMGLAGQQAAQGAQTYGLGGQMAATAGGLSGAAQQAQETYGMNTAQMAGMYGQLQNQQAMNMLGNMQNAGQMFAKRPFGLGGTNLAQSELSQAGAYNSFQQANYATMNGIAFNSAQMQAQQNQLAAQQQAGMVSAGVGAAGAVASAAAAAAAITCWVARAIFGEDDPRWVMFMNWLHSPRCPSLLRRLYLRFGQRLAPIIKNSRVLNGIVRHLMENAIHENCCLANCFRMGTL